MELSQSDALLKRQLQEQIAELEHALASRRRMLALLRGSEKERLIRPKTKCWLLREYLERFHPEGIPIKNVPTALKEMGYISREIQPTTNWLRQPKPQQDFFLVEKGWVKVRPDIAQLDEKLGYTEPSAGSEVFDCAQVSPE